jgi:hypothetical protein
MMNVGMAFLPGWLVNLAPVLSDPFHVMRCSGTLMRLLHPILGVAAAILLAPQAAQAAALDPLGPCYRSVDSETRESVRVHGTGFTPGETVRVSIDGAVVEEGYADTNGEVSGDVPAPYQEGGERPFTVTVTEARQPANTASASSRVTALTLRLSPQRAAPSDRVRFVGRGFTDDTEVFAHYVRKGKLRKTVSLGTPQAPCGRVSVKRRQIPIKRPAVGRWTLQVDNQPFYSAEPLSVFVRLAIAVRRVPRPSS